MVGHILSRTQLMLTKINKLIIEIHDIKKGVKANKLINNNHKLSKSMVPTDTHTPGPQNTSGTYDAYCTDFSRNTTSPQNHPDDSTYTANGHEEHPTHKLPTLIPCVPHPSHTSSLPPSASTKSSSELVGVLSAGGTSESSDSEMSATTPESSTSLMTTDRERTEMAEDSEAESPDPDPDEGRQTLL